MSRAVGIDEFVYLIDKYPIIDVRSPSEFERGHIPSAINIPLFNDEERAAVGTTYIKKGRHEAVKLGLEIVGPKLVYFVNEINNRTQQKNILVYCWRGGMRSASMSWLFELVGYKPLTLIGGYKSYRRFVQSYFDKPYQLFVLGGMTGSGKTEILKALKERGEQVIDLEGLANHKGSAFGWINQPAQPSTEHFENLLFDEIRKQNPEKPIWVEDESISIGKVFIPQAFYERMSNSPSVAIEVSVENRINRLLKEYTHCESKHLIDSVSRIQKRLGSEKAAKCIKLIQDGNMAEAIRIVLQYYDKTYRYGLENKKIPPKIITFDGNVKYLLDKLAEQKLC